MSTPRRTTGFVPLVAAAAPEKSVEALAAKRGTAFNRPALRPDAVVRRQLQMGEVRWWVKNLETMKYYIFHDHEWRLIELMDGTRTRPEIVEEYNALYQFDPIDIAVVLDYEEMLRKISLLAQSVAEHNLELLGKLKTARQRAAEEKAEGFNPFFLLFHVLNPDRFLNRTVKYVRWIWTPPVVALWSVAVAWTVGVFALHFEQLWKGTYELYAFLHKPFLDAVHFFFILSFLGFFHEFGHAYTVKIYGGEVRDIGIALLYFTPAFYCDTTDALLFPSKWHRLWVNTAGIYVEGFVCSAATAVWVASYPDSLAHEIAYKTMLFTGISTIFFNVNPLIKIDGYHGLTSLLEMPDLREDAFRHIGAVFQKHVLRLPVQVVPASRRRRRIYWIYGILALAYTAVIMRFIGGIFYNLFEKYFPNVAIVLLVLTLHRIFRKRVRLVTRTARLFYLDKKELLMSRRSRVPLAVAAGAFALLFFIPWTRRAVSAQGVLRPASVARIEAPEDVRVDRVLVTEGDQVEEGAEIFHLASPAAEAGLAHFTAESERLLKAANAGRDAGTAGVVFESERRASAAHEGLLSEDARERRLAARSPISGRILTPRLPDLQGRYVAAGGLLAEVGDTSRLVAELPVSERLFEDLWVGAEVRALLGQRPLRPVHGEIKRISSATLDQPRTVAGLSEPAAPSAHPDRFVVVAVFDNPGAELRPGDIVSAKIYSRRASYAARAWRVLRHWLRTVVW